MKDRLNYFRRHGMHADIVVKSYNSLEGSIIIDVRTAKDGETVAHFSAHFDRHSKLGGFVLGHIYSSKGYMHFDHEISAYCSFEERINNLLDLIIARLSNI